MQNIRWQFLLGIGLITLSALLYSLHFLIFQDLHHILIFLISDIAFIPIEVLLVTVIIHKFLSIREKKQIMEKMNMLIGVFFSEMGTKLCADFSNLDKNAEQIKQALIVNNNWTKKEFKQLTQNLKQYTYKVEPTHVYLQALKDYLKEKRSFLLTLIENPNLLEHDTFTDLLLALFHLTEELEHRQGFQNISQEDYFHLCGDIQRAYKLLIYEWGVYMQYLKENYPYLFSLALRTNPFDDDALISF